MDLFTDQEDHAGVTQQGDSYRELPLHSTAVCMYSLVSERTQLQPLDQVVNSLSTKTEDEIIILIWIKSTLDYHVNLDQFLNSISTKLDSSQHQYLLLSRDNVHFKILSFTSMSSTYGKARMLIKLY